MTLFDSSRFFIFSQPVLSNKRVLAWFGILFLLTFHYSRPTNGAACCTSATAFGVGRLLMWEDFALGVKTSFKKELGSFDETRVFHSKDFAQSRNEFRSDFWGIVGLSADASVFLLVPVSLPFESSKTSLKYGLGPGDLQVGYRHQIIGIGEFVELPGMALTASMVFPTGKSSLYPGVTSIEATGRGLFSAMIGLSIEKTFLPWFAQLNLGAQFPFPTPKTSSTPSYWPGLGANLNLSIGREVTKDLVLTLLTLFSFEGTQYFDQRPHPNSSRYKSGLAIATSWKMTPHITLQGSLSSDLPFGNFGKHYPGAINCGIGIRYGFF